MERSENLLGVSQEMRQVEKLIELASQSDGTVLIFGETGTGKDSVARAIHARSQRAREPLTIIDCTAVPEDYGSFESLSEGSSGIVLLDEIGDLNSQMQAMLVRVLKELPSTPLASDQVVTDAMTPRIVATTQYNLAAMVKDKQFREDLYYRLNVTRIQLPPLRARGSDILMLAETFLQRANSLEQKKISRAAAKVLLDYEWPGNVRELQNLMYHLNFMVRSSTIEASDLPMLAEVSTDEKNENSDLDYYNAVATLEKRLLIKALKNSGGSRAEAARLLGINRQLLYSKLKAHGLMDSMDSLEDGQ